VDSHGRLLPHAPHYENPAQALGYVLIQLERFGEARPLLERARDDSLEQGAFPAAAFASMALSELMCRLGEWQRAARLVAELNCSSSSWDWKQGPRFRSIRGRASLLFSGTSTRLGAPPRLASRRLRPPE
jgi:hypothetical protein